MPKETDQPDYKEEGSEEENDADSSGSVFSESAGGEEENADLERFSPGAALSQARERSGVSLETIAEKTAIPIAKLMLLENDQFDQLGAELFVIGYLKKYAVILDLPEKELISDYRSYRAAVLDSTSVENADKTSLETHRPSLSKSSNGLSINTEIKDSSLSNRNMFSSESSSKSIFKRFWFWLLIVVTLVAWGAYEMFFGERSIVNSRAENSVILSPLSNDSSSTNEESPEVESQELVSIGTEEPNLEPAVIEPATKLSDSDTENALVSAVNPTSSDGVVEDNIVKAVAEDNQSTTSSTLDVLPKAEPDLEMSELEKSTQEDRVSELSSNETVELSEVNSDLAVAYGQNDHVAIPEKLVSADLDRLDIDFNDDCWLEVKDSSGRVSITKLQRGGDNLRLFGVAPFTIKLGNARAAQVHINSRLFDIPISGNRKTTKFMVYKQSENDI